MKVEMELYKLADEICRQGSCVQELDMVLWQKLGKTEEKEDCMLVEKEPGKMEQQVDCKLVEKEDCKKVKKEDCMQVDCKL